MLVEIDVCPRQPSLSYVLLDLDRHVIHPEIMEAPKIRIKLGILGNTMFESY